MLSFQNDKILLKKEDSGGSELKYEKGINGIVIYLFIFTPQIFKTCNVIPQYSD